VKLFSFTGERQRNCYNELRRPNSLVITEFMIIKSVGPVVYEPNLRWKQSTNNNRRN